MADHSPTPWRQLYDNQFLVVCGDEHFVADTFHASADDDAEAFANAEHIVRCVNAFDALTTALTDYLDWGAMTSSDRYLFEEKFRRALTNAGVTL